jgi:hypothetical protein
MKTAMIKNGVCINVGIFETDKDIDDMRNVFSGEGIDLIPLQEGFGIGDGYKDETWYKINPYKPILSSAELREQAYQTMTTKADGTGLIAWEGKAISVDQANKIYLEYSAEGSSKATEIQALIVAAKTYIRELYPDE